MPLTQVQSGMLSTGGPAWDSSGNVGIGTSSPTVRMTINQGTTGTYFRANASTADRPLTLTTTTTTNNGDTHTLNIDSSTGIFAVATNGTERTRVDSSGNVLVGRTSTIGSSRFVVESNAATVNPVSISNTNTVAGGDYAIIFYRVGSIVGSVQTSLSATSYITSSDYRLKENIQPMAGALAKVAALKPCTYTWKVDGSDGQGFIAHELAEVCPDAVTGEKDAVNEDGSIKPQGVDTSFLVATLTAAIQEQQAMIEELKAKVAAMEK